MKSILFAIVLMLPAQAYAQSFYPLPAGKRLCELRRQGVAQNVAIQMAIDENWSDTRVNIPIVCNGQSMSRDALIMANYTIDTCPSLLK